MPIGTQIRKLRKQKGLSLADLARRCGTSAPTLHRYEGGWDRFEVATLRRIAAALGTRLDVRMVPLAAQKEPRAKKPGDLVDLLAPLFWDKDLTEDDLGEYPIWVLKRTLMFGSWVQVSAVRHFYGERLVLQAANARGVDARTRNFWNILLSED